MLNLTMAETALYAALGGTPGPAGTWKAPIKARCTVLPALPACS